MMSDYEMLETVLTPYFNQYTRSELAVILYKHGINMSRDCRKQQYIEEVIMLVANEYETKYVDI